MARVPDKIGKYPVLSKLAEGGMGVVYKATHPTLDRTVIIKKLTFQGNANLEARFKREASLMMDFRNEHIVQVFDHFKQGASYYIVMEFVDGTDFGSLLRNRRYLPTDIALLIFNEICRALKYAHDRNVIHRDIKPENILISKEGMVKLTDFGVATILNEEAEQLTAVNMQLGTPLYMSPEQIISPHSVDRRTDIYAMGVMLYEMVTGQKPYKGAFNPDLIMKVNKGRYTPPHKIMPRINLFTRRLIKKAMHHKVTRRYKDLGIVIGKISKHLKSYPNQPSINQAIQDYIAGNELKDRKNKKLVKIKWSFGKPLAVGMTLLLVFFTGALYAYWQGVRYEYFYPEEYGVFKVVAKARKDGRPSDSKYLHATLFKKENKKVREVKDLEINFKENVEAEDKNYYVFESSILYAEKGEYQIRLDIEHDQYQEFFYLAPRELQSEKQSWTMGQKIQFSQTKHARQLPLMLNYTVVNSYNQLDITKKIRMNIFTRGWIPFEDFIRRKSNKEKFTSGRSYSFRVSNTGYYSKNINVTVPADQTRLNLKIELTPLSGKLSMRSKVSNTKALLNNLPYYLVGGRKPQYKKIPDLEDKTQTLTLPQGEYYITVKEEKTWLDWIMFSTPSSKTQKINIKQGRTLRVFVDKDMDNKSLNLKIRN